MCAVALKRRTNRAPIAAVLGAKRAPFPGFIEPCDPTLHDRAPDRPGWLHEIKIDGYRAQVHIHHRRVTVYSRSGYNWTDHFHQIAHAVRALSRHDLIIDGEAIVFGNTGLPDFRALRRESRETARRSPGLSRFRSALPGRIRLAQRAPARTQARIARPTGKAASVRPPRAGSLHRRKDSREGAE
jgi:ATP-dependent DNA ligase